MRIQIVVYLTATHRNLAFPRGEGGPAHAGSDEGWRYLTVQSRTATEAIRPHFRPHSSSVSLRSTASPPGEAKGASRRSNSAVNYNFRLKNAPPNPLRRGAGYHWVTRWGITSCPQDASQRSGFICPKGKLHQYMPPPWAAAAAMAASAAGSGLSTTRDSVVSTQAAMEAAFSREERVTLVGSTMPAGIISTYSSE